MGQLRRARPHPIREHPLEDEEEAAPNEDGGVRARVSVAKPRRQARTRLPPVRLPAPVPDPDPDDDMDDGRSHIHYYRDNCSIFSDNLTQSHSFPVFSVQKREMPWERILEREASVVHAYSTQRSSLRKSTSLVAPGLEPWRRVREKERRQRPPRDAVKRAMPGSTLDKRRAALLEAQHEAQRARIGANDDDENRVSICAGGSSSYVPSARLESLKYLTPAVASSAPQIVMASGTLPKLL